MTVTAGSMILRSLRLIGEKVIGGTLDAAEKIAYLYDLNSFMDSVGLERLMIPHLKQDSHALTSTIGTYTIGPGGDISTARPSKIEQAWIRDSSDGDTPIEIISREAYDRIILKSVDGSYPNYLYYNPTVPLGTIKLYPVPAAGLTLYTESWKLLQKFGGIDVPLDLPPGYQRFIEFNFAIEVAGGFANVQPEVAKIARDSKAVIKSFNLPDTKMRLDAGIVNAGFRGNILTGP